MKIWKKYLLTSGKIGQHLKEEIDLQVTEGRLKDAQLRNQLDPLYKNVLRRQNPYEIVFKGMSRFDGQNPIVGSLLAEIKNGKLTAELFQNSLTERRRQKFGSKARSGRFEKFQ